MVTPGGRSDAGGTEIAFAALLIGDRALVIEGSTLMGIAAADDQLKLVGDVILPLAEDRLRVRDLMAAIGLFLREAVPGTRSIELIEVQQ